VISRRELLRSGALAGAALVAGTRARAQQAAPAQVSDTSNLFAMDQAAARSVRLPRKPAAAPSMSPDDRDALEHRIRCQCGCTLDVFTCRTTDFSCQVSPAMHRDVLALVDGGYTAPEILDAFVKVYGDRVLMAPPRVGFNIVGYVLPGAAIGIGAVVLALLMRRWRHTSPSTQTATVRSTPRVSSASPDEMARLEAAIRDDS
jgi:cytochrome c-type biogenesis protein CcmH